jgi:AcrR family transcriptional regulator
MAKPRGKRPVDRNTEERILDAASTVFVRRGTAGARMQEIADEAGVNKALLHYYFRSKSRLAEAVFQRVAMRLFPPVMAVLGSDAEIEDKVERVIAIELEELSRVPTAPGYVLSELSQHPDRARQFIKAMTGLAVEGVAPAMRDKLDRQLKARARAGTMRPIPAEQFVVNLLSLCVFPFAARPMLSAAFGLDERGFQRFIDQRKTELPAFFLNALRP